MRKIRSLMDFYKQIDVKNTVNNNKKIKKNFKNEMFFNFFGLLYIDTK